MLKGSFECKPEANSIKLLKYFILLFSIITLAFIFIPIEKWKLIFDFILQMKKSINK